ncbi:MAG: tRNA guanosine(34) transglycosylase Tgt, partial [Desulfomicrobium sp.]|nr:tRNA guanosine(34) transglycosylase Tgt [Desulfomicrobium sp.]
RHLYQAQEILSYRLNTIHNLAFFLTVVTGARKAIEDGAFQAYKTRFEDIYDT